MDKAPRYACRIWLAALFLFLVYRAKTQSFTIDEAYTFELYVDQPLSAFLAKYDACNHVLHTFLTWIARRVFGSSELVLRLGSLLGALAYLAIVSRLTRMVAGDGWLRTAAVLALTSNPLVLDFLVASRGYGLALGLFCWSSYFAIRWLGPERDQRLLYRAGIFAGLSIGANLTMLIPSFALGSVLLALGLRRRWSGIADVANWYGVPAVVLAFIVVILPLTKATVGDFYLGTASLAEAGQVLWTSSFAAHGAGPVAAMDRFRDSILAALLGCTVAAGLYGSVQYFRGDARYPSIVAAVSGLSVAVCVGVLAMANLIWHVPYPYGRTGLYLIPLTLLVFVALAGRAGDVGRVSGSIGLAALGLVFLTQVEPRAFVDWRFDQGTNILMRHIAADARSRASASEFRVAASVLHEMSVKYYRKRNHLHQMSPDVRAEAFDPNADYYVLHGADREWVASAGLRVIAEDPEAGSLAAAKRR